MKRSILTTLTALLFAVACMGQSKQDSTKYWFANDRITATTMPGRIGFQTYTAPSNSITFNGKDLKTPILTIDMIKNGKITSVINNSGYDTLILIFDKKRMIWKNDSTLILINK